MEKQQRQVRLTPIAILKRVQTFSQSLPHFHAYFTVSYGLSRKELEELNFLIKSSDTSPYTTLVRKIRLSR